MWDAFLPHSPWHAMAQPKVCQAKDGRIGARPNHDDKEKDVPEDPPGKEEEED